MKDKKGYALVLAGGGAKGAYQIGAWKAFNELGIEIKAAAGASVGALNAALIAQGDFKKAEELWDGISLEKIVCIPPELVSKGQLYLDKGNIRYLKDLNKSILKFGGLDSAPLLTLIKDTISEQSIRKSGFDLGLVTFNVGKLKPAELFLKEIPPGELAQFLLASASFPAFKRTTIDGNKYTDGGIYDNIPFQMIKNRGYKNIIVIDISGAGRNRRPDITGTRTVYIKNSLDIGGILNFNTDVLQQLKLMGYLDTLKVFGELEGIRYFFRSDPGTRKTLTEMLSPEIDTLHPLLPAEMRVYRDNVIPLVEGGAAALGIPVLEEYTLKGLLLRMVSTYKQVQNTVYGKTDKSFLPFYRDLLTHGKKAGRSRSAPSRSPYEYYHAVQEFTHGTRSSLIYKALNSFFPELPAAIPFLALLSRSFPL